MNQKEIIFENDDYEIYIDHRFRGEPKILRIKSIHNLNNLNITNIETIYIPDIGLRDIDSLNNLLTTSDVNDLDINRNKLISISGIEKFTNLVELSLSRCDLESIDLLSPLVNLETLNLRYNQITSIEPIKNLIKLRRLFISDNFIVSTEALANLPKLIWLDINNNYDLSFEGLKKNPRFADINIIYRVRDPRKFNLYQLNYQEYNEIKNNLSDFNHRLDFNSKFKNYQYRIKFGLRELINLIIRKKIIIHWFSFFDSKRNFDGFNRFFFLSNF